MRGCGEAHGVAARFVALAGHCWGCARWVKVVAWVGYVGDSGRSDADADELSPVTERPPERALLDTGSLTMSEFSTGSGPAAGASLRGEPVVTTLRRGDVVGRYVIITQLGQGGMGVVYAAYDPELDRRVALKLLIAGEDGEAPLEARTRLLREAQALAQLSHPAVVAIHDVGTLGRQVWLAMEFVAGETLTAWLAAAPRGWAEVLAMFRSAGEGLAAAHAAGLVHRDFKPKSECPPQTPPLPPSGRILADRGDLRGAVCRVMPRHAAVLATGWQL